VYNHIQELGIPGISPPKISVY